MSVLFTTRLELVPITLPLVEAVMAHNRVAAESIVEARFPEAWPGRALIERAFTSSLEDIRANPARRLWGDRVMVLRASERCVVGSVIFHGGPDEEGTVEVGYGVESASQGKGYATEAVTSAVDWAIEQPHVNRVVARAFAWHTPSLRVLAKVGMKQVGTSEHEMLGEMLVFER